MAAADLALAVFTAANAIRIVGYLPQIVRIARDPGPASGVSCTTWIIFGLSHASTVAYAWLSLHDWKMAAVFSANALCCLCIVGLTWAKRSRFRSGRLRARPFRTDVSSPPKEAASPNSSALTRTGDASAPRGSQDGRAIGERDRRGDPVLEEHTMRTLAVATGIAVVVLLSASFTLLRPGNPRSVSAPSAISPYELTLAVGRELPIEPGGNAH